MKRVRQLAKRLRHWLQHRYLPLHLAVLATLLCAPSLWLGWQVDDYIHRAALIGLPEFPDVSRSPVELFAFIKGEEEDNRRAIAAGWLPWWGSKDLRLAFFRPVTGLTHWIDYKLWPETPWLMHVQSLVWLGGAVAAAAFFYRRTLGCPTLSGGGGQTDAVPRILSRHAPGDREGILGPATPTGWGGPRSIWITGLAALLFAVDDAHGLPAVWLSNRNAIIAVLFGLLALIAHDLWRRDGWRIGALLAPLALLAGVLSNEGAVATGAYLLAYAVFLDRDTWARRVCSLVPYAAMGTAWWVAYKQMGYGAVGSAMYIDPGATPMRFAQAVAERAPILLFGQWVFPSNLHSVLSQRAGQAMWLATLGFLAVLAVILLPLLKRDTVARFFAVGMVLAVLPPCATFPADRLLVFVGIGGMGLLAQFVAAVLQKADWLPVHRWWRWPARAMCIVFIAVHLGLAPFGLTQKAGSVKAFGAIIDRAAASLPSDPAVATQTVLIVNTPSVFVSLYGPFIQAHSGNTIPARMLALGSGIYPTEIHRQDEHTLVIRPEGGFVAPPGSPRPGHEADQPSFAMLYGCQLFDGLFRDHRPMRVGERIELTDLAVEVTAVTEDGRPAEAAFRFAATLEDPSYRWLQWKDGVYVQFPLPGVGRTVTLPAVTLPF